MVDDVMFYKATERMVFWQNEYIKARDELWQEREANATLRRELTAALSDLAHSTYACPHCQMAILQCGECERKVRMQGG